MDYLLTLAADPSAWLGLITLVAMEVVLGVDNVIFIALLSSKLPPPSAAKTRQAGLGLSLVLRLILVTGAAYAIRLTAPLFAISGQLFSIRDLILIFGGLFLVFKATLEIHQAVEPFGERHPPRPKQASSRAIAAQIVLIDLVFSIDSIITAVGMTEHVPIMIGAVIMAVLLMLAASGPLAGFIRRNPTVVMLALGFLLLIGSALIADGFGFHLPRGYIYAAMAFSAAVEGLNVLARKKDAAQRREENSRTSPRWKERNWPLE